MSWRRSKWRADCGVGDQHRIDSTILHSSTASCLFYEHSNKIIVSQKFAIYLYDMKKYTYLGHEKGCKTIKISTLHHHYYHHAYHFTKCVHAKSSLIDSSIF